MSRVLPTGQRSTMEHCNQILQTTVALEVVVVVAVAILVLKPQGLPVISDRMIGMPSKNASRLPGNKNKKPCSVPS